MRRKPSRDDFKGWLQTSLRRYPQRPIAVPIVWKNHYSVVVVPRHPQRESVLFFDPNHRHRRYHKPPTDIILNVLQAPRLEQTHEELTRAVQRRLHDVFCSTWIVWWLCVVWRSRRRPLFTRRPTVFDVIRFLQHAARVEKADFLEYLRDEKLQRNAHAEEETRLCFGMKLQPICNGR